MKQEKRARLLEEFKQNNKLLNLSSDSDDSFLCTCDVCGDKTNVCPSSGLIVFKGRYVDFRFDVCVKCLCVEANGIDYAADDYWGEAQ